jgi:hypothetical protein
MSGAGAPQQGQDGIQSGSETAPNAGEYLKNQGQGQGQIQSGTETAPNAGEYLKNQGQGQGQQQPQQQPQQQSNHWNDSFGKHTTSTGPDGQTVYHAQDGQSYVKDNSNLAQRMGLQRWTKVDPNTGQALGRPSFMRR